MAADPGKWLQQAIALRADVTRVMPKSASTPHDAADALVTVRAKLDTAETIYLAAMLYRGETRKQLRAAEAKYDDAYDLESARIRRSAVGDRYQSGRQHETDVKLACVNELMGVRAARVLADSADDLTRQLELIYRGMDACRHDLGARLRYLQWESVLERGT